MNPLFPCLLLFGALVARAEEPVKVTSPGQSWNATVETAKPLTIALRDAHGRLLVSQQIGMQLEKGPVPAAEATVSKVTTRSVDETIQPPVRQVAAKLRDRYNEATILFSDKTALVVRLYEEGLAYRFLTSFDGKIIVVSEDRICRFEGDPTVYFGREKHGFFSHNEVGYEVRKLSELKKSDLASEPFTVRPADSKGLLVFSESALEEYPGQWIRVGENSLDGVNPGYPAKEVEEGDRNVLVEKREPYIAKTDGSRAFPWRTVAAAAKDSDLLVNELNFLVADVPRFADTTWIKPGKVQWDWWHDWTWNGSRLPINNDTYKLYIDFASKYGLPYVNLDEGWYELGDLTKQAPGIDVPALVKYGREKNVGIILWAASATLKKQFDEMMPTFEKWGVKGLKVDFFQRDDQVEVEFYWKLAAEAAKRKLFLDLHGAHKPAGLQRAYPNTLNFEGVRGLEQNKGSRVITPTHDLELPFTRLVAGPMDYTPGAMLNAQPEKFHPDNSNPMSQGTRCHELAKYVVYTGPLQMLCDTPARYYREPKTMEFLGPVPSTWDESRVLDGKIGEYAAMVRRSGDTWFFGAMTNEQSRDLDIDLGLLGQGEYELTIWQDGPKAADDATDFVQKKIRVKAGDKLPIKLAPSGGWAAIARPVK